MPSPSLLHSVKDAWMPVLFTLEEALAFSFAKENLGYLHVLLFFLLCILPLGQKLEMKGVQGGATSPHTQH